jgi:hypothetical protein
VGILAWAVPGVGYVWGGRILRGIIACAVIFSMFAAGLFFGGHLFSLRNVTDVGLLAYIYGFCDLGVGLTYLLCQWSGVGLVDQAQKATAEYGNIFLMVAGLLNFLAALDSFDILVGRKL